MKPIYLTLISILLTLTSFSQIQPQFKFWLAFEDSIGAKDTLWVVIDSTTNSSFLDSSWGEIPIINADSGKFLTYFQYSIDKKKDTTKVYTAATYEKEVSIWIGAVNYHLPITVRWDSSLLRNNDLPWEIRASAFYNYFTAYAGLDFINADGYFQMEFTDSILLPKFNWFTKNHFPLQFYLSETPLYVGEEEKENLGFETPIIWPNPSIGEFSIKLTEKIENVEILDLNGKELFNINGAYSPILQLKPNLNQGIYLIRIKTKTQTYHEKIIIN